ncbi:MAG: OFA family MFS transporter [Candidatus Dadabacteria bacterium]|nr:OFA family MFS transporter [Candidatus Dadabacteria bacterium]MYA48028.1 OFA family MFS transporter [Candidatus Dadabacteria bacterium]MYF47588.1 OFA family MFS transporter [Candidatus Dadabacteria bacterium]MYG82699.1 OFA family MFS transporter [Candidatus Dadabacteria bacterium]MYK49095.1 OFA family MFS transporter [Candidatus Dadabacteria bacterium]
MLRNRFFYGWVIVIAGHLLITLDGMVLYSFGIFLPYLNEAFGLSTAVGSSFFSLRCVCMAFSFVFAGRLIDTHDARYLTFFGGLIGALGFLLSSYANNIWELYITYSVMVGIGDGFLYILPVTVISRWFVKKRALAIGIATAGVPVSGLVVNPLTTWLIESFGYERALVYISVIFTVILCSALLVKNRPEEMGLRPYGENSEDAAKDTGASDWSAKEAFSHSSFWLMYAAFFLGFNTFLIIVVNLFNFSIESGITPLVAAGAPAFIGVGSIIGRIFFSGVITNILSDVRILFVCYFFQASSIILILSVVDVWSLYLFGFLFGLFYSGWVPMFPTILGKFYGLKSLGSIFGIFGTGFSLAAISGPLVSGLLFDITQSYHDSLVVATAASFVTAFLVLLIKTPVKKINKTTT